MKKLRSCFLGQFSSLFLAMLRHLWANYKRGLPESEAMLEVGLDPQLLDPVRGLLFVGVPSSIELFLLPLKKLNFLRLMSENFIVFYVMFR